MEQVIVNKTAFFHKWELYFLGKTNKYMAKQVGLFFFSFLSKWLLTKVIDEKYACIAPFLNLSGILRAGCIQVYKRGMIPSAYLQ